MIELKGKTVFIWSNSCTRRNTHIEILKPFFFKNGWSITKNHKKADLIICGTCALNKYFEEISIRHIIKFQNEKKKDSNLIVGGCLPIINKNQLNKVFNGFTFGSRDTEKLDRFLSARFSISDLPISFILPKYAFNISDLCYLLQGAFHSYIFYKTFYKNCVFIEVSTGCSEKCSYCGIKYATGNIIKSVKEAEVLKEFKDKLKQGYKKFVLEADNLGDYGKDIDTNITNLLEKILKIDGKFYLALKSINPNFLENKKLKKLLSSDRICKIDIHLQSGSNKILKKMRRNYTSEFFVKTIKELKKRNPKLLIFSDVIIGFPGESEEDFRKTVDIIDKANLDIVNISPYSDRPNTESSYMPNHIPEKVIKKRSTYLYKHIIFRRLKTLLINQ